MLKARQLGQTSTYKSSVDWPTSRVDRPGSYRLLCVFVKHINRLVIQRDEDV